MKIVIFKKKTDKIWLSINNKSDVKLFQIFCCRILRLYISSINQHKKLHVIAGLAFYNFIHMDEVVRIGVIMGYFDARM